MVNVYVCVCVWHVSGSSRTTVIKPLFTAPLPTQSPTQRPSSMLQPVVPAYIILYTIIFNNNNNTY